MIICQYSEIILLKLVLKLKTNKLLKLLLVEMKANNSLLMRMEMAGMTQNKSNALFSMWSLELEKKTKLVELVSY